MDLLPSVLEGVRLIGWMLVNFLWQGLLLGLLYSFGRAVLPRGVARYRLGMVVLLTLAICPVLTTFRLLDSPAPVRSVVGSATSTAAPMHALVHPAWRFDGLMDAVLPWAVLVWALCVSILSLRAWRQWRRLKCMVRAAEALSVWQQHVDVMAQRFGLRRKVVVVCSKVISTPVLVGWIRPVILLPLAVVSKFPIEQIQLILAHELAHLRRWDPLANLFQVVLETLFFYHPIVHLISRDVRNEREICCDHMALRMTDGNPRAFGAALAELGELREQYGSLLVAASGGVLLDRVQHLMLPPRQETRTPVPARFAAVVVGAILIAMVLRSELRQSHIQQRLDRPLLQLQSMMVSDPFLAAVSFMPVLHVADLVLDRHRPFTRLAPLRDSKLEPSGFFLPKLPLPANTLSAAVLPQIAYMAVARDLVLAGPIESSSPQRSMAAPAPISIRQPRYPLEALLHHTQGRVIMEFVVSANGRVKDLTIVEAKPAGVFDQAARKAMQGWKFAAGKGADNDRRYRQTMVFSLIGAASRDGAEVANPTAEIRRNDCEVATGSHICRRLDQSTVFH